MTPPAKRTKKTTAPRATYTQRLEGIFHKKPSKKGKTPAKEPTHIHKDMILFETLNKIHAVVTN